MRSSLIERLIFSHFDCGKDFFLHFNVSREKSILAALTFLEHPVLWIWFKKNIVLVFFFLESLAGYCWSTIWDLRSVIMVKQQMMDVDLLMHPAFIDASSDRSQLRNDYACMDAWNIATHLCLVNAHCLLLNIHFCHSFLSSHAHTSKECMPLFDMRKAEWIRWLMQTCIHFGPVYQYNQYFLSVKFYMLLWSTYSVKDMDRSIIHLWREKIHVDWSIQMVKVKVISLPAHFFWLILYIHREICYLSYNF